jgi:O-succinylbenzoic acid--CoA ligase
MASPLDIDWTSSDNLLLLNPRLPRAQADLLRQIWDDFSTDFSGQIGLATSGSSSKADDVFGKLVVLSKQAVLVSARSVNAHLQSTAQDIWLKKLPDFHVGGLGIHARSFLSGARVVDMDASAAEDSEKWDAQAFYQKLVDEKVSLTALVPAQLFDLLQAGFLAPRDLRAVIIGGAAFSQDLFQRASKAGWVALPSYGMTETCSQIATASIAQARVQMHSLQPELPEMQILSHSQIRADADGVLQIQSGSLLTGYIRWQDGRAVFQDPKVDGWFTSEDRGEVHDGTLRVWGRGQDFLKIGGESVLLPKLEAIFERLRTTEFGQAANDRDGAILAVPDSRLGSVIHLLTASTDVAQADELVRRFNQEVLPFERIRQTHFVAQIPRSALGKLLRAQALAMIGF